MEKIPTVFLRNEEKRSLVTRMPNPACQWVFDGEGVPTRKYDGTSCAVLDGHMLKRYEVKRGKTAPDRFLPADEIDEVTGKQPGWVPVADGPGDKWHREALQAWDNQHKAIADGTYELLGPKVQGNPEGYPSHILMPHAQAEEVEDGPRTYDGIKNAVIACGREGIVYHHPDGRMAKIKIKDFGLRRTR